MLLDPGPIQLFTGAEIPRPTIRGTFAHFTAREAAVLVDASAAAGVAAGQFAPALGAGGDLRAASDLAAAVSEHDRQSRGSDSEIASVAAGAGALEGQLAGLTSELAGELANASMPEEPDAPDDRGNMDWADPEYFEHITAVWLSLLGREPPQDVLQGYFDEQQPYAVIVAGILGSEEYQERVQQGLVQPLSGVGGSGGRSSGRSGGGGGGPYQGQGDPDVDDAQRRLDELGRRYGVSVESNDAQKLKEKREGYARDGRDPTDADREFEEQYQRRGE